jgi:hypothetical protein
VPPTFPQGSFEQRVTDWFFEGYSETAGSPTKERHTTHSDLALNVMGRTREAGGSAALIAQR